MTGPGGFPTAGPENMPRSFSRSVAARLARPSPRCPAMPDETVARLRGEVIDALKRRFVRRDEVIDLIALAVVAGEHLFLHGPPGTAKSALIRQFASAVQGH